MPKIVEKVYETTQYNIFKLYKGNRVVKEPYVRRLVEKIKSKDYKVPVIVDSKMNIVDGQHRLEAYKIVGVPVRYLIRNDMKIEDIRSLNSVHMKWSLMEYLMSHVKLGTPDYKYIEWFIRHYSIQVTEAVSMLQGFHYSTSEQLDAFKNGKFKMTHLEEASKYAERIREIHKYFENAYSKKFIWAMLSVFANKSFKWKHFIDKLSKNSSKMRVQASRVDYIVCVERLYNYNSTDGKKIKLDLYQRSTDL